MVVKDYYTEELLVKVFENGKQIYTSPDVKDIAVYHKKCSRSFWEQYKRVTLPEIYKVDLSEKLYDLKHELLGDKA